MPQATGTVTKSRPDSATPGMRGSHAHFLEQMKLFEPYRFDARQQATGDELDLAASVLRAALSAFERYLVAVTADVEAHTWAFDADIRGLMDTLQDFRNDLCGRIERAAETVRQERLEQGRAA